MSRAGWPYRQRYVSLREKADQTAASQRLFEMAQQLSFWPEVAPASRKSPFLAYHADCQRTECTLAHADEALARTRAQICLDAWARVTGYLRE